MSSTSKNTSEMYFVMVHFSQSFGCSELVTTATMYKSELDVLKMMNIGGISITEYWIATKITNKQMEKFPNVAMAMAVLSTIRNWEVAE